MLILCRKGYENLFDTKNLKLSLNELVTQICSEGKSVIQTAKNPSSKKKKRKKRPENVSNIITLEQLK